jgi:RHS repeat-associated protein
VATVSATIFNPDEGATCPSHVGTGDDCYELQTAIFGIGINRSKHRGERARMTVGSERGVVFYRPDGTQLGIYAAGLLVKETIPLPGGETAVYNGSGLNFIRHTDWLGSSRLATTWAHAVYSKEAYAPFGETYNEAGTPDRSFTGQDQDVASGSGGSGTYDFLFRKYDPSAGRWLSPDPSGWGATAPLSGS